MHIISYRMLTSELKQDSVFVSYDFSGKSTSASSLMHLTQSGLKLKCGVYTQKARGPRTPLILAY